MQGALRSIPSYRKSEAGENIIEAQLALGVSYRAAIAPTVVMRSAASVANQMSATGLITLSDRRTLTHAKPRLRSQIPIPVAVPAARRKRHHKPSIALRRGGYRRTPRTEAGSLTAKQRRLQTRTFLFDFGVHTARTGPVRAFLLFATEAARSVLIDLVTGRGAFGTSPYIYSVRNRRLLRSACVMIHHVLQCRRHRWMLLT
jgi:hypothetical protein